MDANTIITLVVLGVSAWNAWHNQTIKNTVLELQLNLKREFNGRYQTIDGFKSLERRVERLEDQEISDD